MAIITQPAFLPEPFANTGSKNTIPDTLATPSASAAASWAAGFPSVTSLPLAAGGIAPARDDFNGVLNALSAHAFWSQSGSPYTWSQELNYTEYSIVVGADGNEYRATCASGPDTPAGAINPVGDTSGWKLAILDLSDSVTSTSQTTAASSNAVKIAKDAADNAQTAASAARTAANAAQETANGKTTLAAVQALLPTASVAYANNANLASNANALPSFSVLRASTGFTVPSGGTWRCFSIIDANPALVTAQATGTFAGGSWVAWNFGGVGYTAVCVRISN